ncbi:MAG: ParA family protein [Waterburya sp.]
MDYIVGDQLRVKCAERNRSQMFGCRDVVMCTCLHEDMKIISVLSQKGGAGKTTLVVHLAVAALIDGKSTAVIDLDAQANAAEWGDSRELDEPAVTSAQATRLPKILEAAKNASADLVIIDTPARSESTALAAAKCADLVLIPCRPSVFDLQAIRMTADLTKLVNVPTRVVINAAQSSCQHRPS